MTVLTLKRFLLALLTITLSRPDSASLGFAEEFESRDDVLESEFMYTSRPKRSADPPSASDPDKCSYTFIVPQRKTTGAICVNSKEPEALLENRVNKQELELLNGELHKQRRQIETLQQLVEVDGGVVNEVKLLRKESRNMNARVTQLYMQLLHEIIPPQHRQPPPPPPPVHHSPARPFHPPTYTRHNNQITNEIQSDQNVKAMPPTLPTVPPETHSSSTDKPS
ncbi:angiopoietin-related protein 2-like, partial [Sinocyclocheilus grahami]|uniref:angiopoietin-related protein 2-like n=1 Tax=Sinocyclocheilus grahami TaxID=75366 RepID=UPI0007ACAD8E